MRRLSTAEKVDRAVPEALFQSQVLSSPNSCAGGVLTSAPA